MKYLLISLISFSAWGNSIPKNAHAVDHVWGWECDYGYVQHRTECVKVIVPKHGVLTPDGHGWECKDGRTKYRGECVKEKKK